METAFIGFCTQLPRFALDMSGNNRPPYRPPCAGWEYAWNGKPYQHAKREENNIQQWQNNNCKEGNFPVKRFPLGPDAWLESNGDGTCSPALTHCGETGQPRCGPYPSDVILPTDYELLETFADYGVCKNIGHKVVQARKSWHGTRSLDGFRTTKYRTLTHTANLTGDAVTRTPDGDINWSGDYANYELSSTVNKDSGIIDLNTLAYTKSRENATVGSYTEPMPFYSSPDSMLTGFNMSNEPIWKLMLPSPHGTLDTVSGSPTEGKYVIGYSDIGWENVFDPLGVQDLIEWNGTLDEIIYEMENTVITGGSNISWPPAGTGRCYTPSGSYDETTLSFSYNIYFNFVTTAEEYSIDADYSINIVLEDAYSLANVIADAEDLINQWNPTDNVQYPWRNDEFLSVAPLVTRNEFRSYGDSTGFLYAAIEPPYTPQRWMQIDAWDAGEFPDYTNPISGSYPYTDYNNLPAPKDPNSVVFHWNDATFATAVSNGYGGTSDDWKNGLDGDRAVYAPATSVAYTRFDGSINGAPSGKPGAEFFDYEHETWFGVLGCDATANPDLAELTPYIHSIGARSGHTNDADETDLLLPQQVTQWTNNKNACLLPPGAWIHASVDEVMMQACVFTTVPVRSQNYFGPCGKDRWRPDETKAACVMTDDGTNIVLHSSAASFIPTGTKCVVHTYAGNDGIFTLTTADGINYVRSGALIAEIPAGIIWENNAGLEDDFISAVRFPDAYGICGRTLVTNATQDGANVHFEVADECYLLVGDHVDFTSIAGLGSNVAIVSVESLTAFTVAGTLGAWTSGGYVNSHGAPDYKWDDNSSKGEYVKREWIMTAAGAIDSATCETECLPFQANCVGVVGFWPSLAHTFSNSNITDFPNVADLHFDGTGIYLWQGGFNLAMNDLYWQQPHTPRGGDCDANVTMVDDDGQCLDDEATVDPDTSDYVYTFYYPSAPRVEARCDLPQIDAVAAPALQGTATFPAVSPPEFLGADIQGATTFNDAIIPAKAVTEHGFYLAAYECVCGESPGRYATEYAANGIRCC